MGQAPSGLFYEIEPVAILEPTQHALADVLAKRLSAMPQPVREWYRGDPPMKSVVHAAAKSRSWSAFARQSLRLALIETDEFWEVSVGEGPTPADAERQRLPRTSLPSDLAEAVLEVAKRRTIWREMPRGRRTKS
jgi:hypothetical protein